MPAVTGVTNNGVILRGLSSLPSSTEMLTVDATGLMGRQAIPVGSFGSLTGSPSDNAALAAALAGKVSLSGDTMTGPLVLPAGSAAIPSLQVGTNAGMFQFTNVTLSPTLNGLESARFTTNGLRLGTGAIEFGSTLSATDMAIQRNSGGGGRIETRADGGLLVRSQNGLAGADVQCSAMISTSTAAVADLRLNSSGSSGWIRAGSTNFATIQFGGGAFASNGLFAIRDQGVLVTRDAGGLYWTDGGNNPAGGATTVGITKPSAGSTGALEINNGTRVASGGSYGSLNVGAITTNGRFTSTSDFDVVTPSAAGRETIFKARVSDAGNDAFHIYNATGVDGSFAPGFSGSRFSSNLFALGFIAQTDAANDTGTNPLMIFEARRTSSQTDPNNGTLSPITTRPPFVWQSSTTEYMRMFANGNLALNSTADNGAKLQVNGTIAANGDVQVINPAGSIFGIIRSGNNVLFDGGRKGAYTGSFLAAETSSGYAFDGGWGGVRASSGIGLSNLASSPYNWTLQCGAGYGAIVSNGTNPMFFRVNRTFTSDSNQHYYAIVTNNGSNQYDVGTVNAGVGNFTTRLLNNGTAMIEFGNDNTQIILRQRSLTFGSANSGEVVLRQVTAFSGVLNVIDALSASTYNDIALRQLIVGGAASATTSRIKNNSGALNFRRGDDAADANITAAAGTFTGAVGIGQASPNVALVIRRSGTELPSMRLEDGDITIPMTGLGINPSLNANTVSAWSAAGSTTGGAQMNGFTNNTANAIPMSFIGYSGSASPTVACVSFTGNKSNGGTGVADLSGTELIAGFYAGNGAASPAVTIAANGTISASSLSLTGTITHGFQPLVANPSTVDITNGLIRAVKNTTSGELRIWANDGNVMKSILFS